jgi:hypothetical protein
MDPGTWVDLRNQVLQRLRVFNDRHARRAWDLRHCDPICPHAVMFCYAQPFTGELATTLRGRYQVRAAIRMILDGPEVRRLAHLLHDLARVASDYITAGGLDPRTEQMSTHRDPMVPDAMYLGLAISSLDTPAGIWEQVQRTAEGPADIPGRCYAELTDGTRMLIDRLAADRFGELQIRSTRDLNYACVAVGSQLPWSWTDELPGPIPHDPQAHVTWQKLHALNTVIRESRHAS